MTLARLQDVVSFLSKAAEHLFEGQLDAEVKKQRVELIQEITNLASKPGELDDRETIRFKYAKHKLDAVLKSDYFNDIDISPETEELFNEEIEQFHKLIELGKKYTKITIELPKVISEDSVAQLKSAFAGIKTFTSLTIRNSIPQSLVDSLRVFWKISIAFTNEEVAERTLFNLSRSNSILDLRYLVFDFQIVHHDQRLKQIPILLAEIFSKLGVDVNYFLLLVL
jgi:hypothetical protein